MRDHRFAPGVVLAAVVAGSVALMVSQVRDLWFFGDDWAFLLRRGVTGDAELGVLAPHNEHWVTIPVVLYRVLFSLFGLHHYLPYALLPILAHAVACVVLFLLLRRCRVAPWTALVPVAVFAFFGGGAANLLWDFQITFVGSALFGLLALHSAACDQPSRRTTLLVWVFATASLMCSGMGIPMLLWLGLFVLQRRGLVAAATATVVPGGLLLLWHLTAGSVATQAPPVEVSHLPVFVWRGLGYVWHVATGVPAMGPVLWLVLLAVVLRGRVAPLLRALALSGMVAAVVAYVLIGTSRGFLGDDAGMQGRYTYFGLLFSLPAFAAALGRLTELARGRSRVVAVGWVALVAFFVATGWHATLGVVQQSQALTAGAPERVVAAAEVVRGGLPVLNQYADLPYNPDIKARRLDDASIERALPDVRVSDAERSDAAARLQVAAGPDDLGVGAPVAVAWSRVLGKRREEDGCRSGLALPGAYLTVRASGIGGELSLRAGGDSVVTVLEQDARRSSPARWPLAPGERTHVGTNAPGATLIVVLPSGPMSYCVD